MHLYLYVAIRHEYDVLSGFIYILSKNNDVILAFVIHVAMLLG